MSHRCEVCDEVFNKSNHAQVNCPFCEYKSCTDCNERYLLDTVQDAHCMACRKGWTRETLSTNFTQKFVTKKYKERRENLLLEREKSMMPATQVYVEFEKEVRNISNKIVELRQALDIELRTWTNTEHRELAHFEATNEFEALVLRHNLAQEHRKKWSNIDIDIKTLEWKQFHLIERIHGRRFDVEKRAFVRACPYADCKGFLSTAWKCGLCENWSCPDCHEVKGLVKDADHTCDPNNVATAQLLAKDSRNCPQCSAMIFKINGCDQMWCTQCHTAFSWRTGRIETHTVHNPHYYEYQRTHGGLARQPGDIPCGGLPDWHLIIRAMQISPINQSIITSAYRSHGHGRYVVIPRYAVQDVMNENRDLRIKLMIGDIDENEFKKKIQQREKSHQRKRDIQQVVEMYLTVLLDLFQTFHSNSTTPSSCILIKKSNTDALIQSLHSLRDHYNTTLTKVQFVYKCAIPSINDDFNFRV